MYLLGMWKETSEWAMTYSTVGDYDTTIHIKKNKFSFQKSSNSFIIYLFI